MVDPNQPKKGGKPGMNDTIQNEGGDAQRVIDFTNIGNGRKQTKVEMQGSASKQGQVSNSTIQRDERERLLR